MAHSYAHLYKVPTTAFRFFTVYGPWGRPDMALFKFMKAMLADEAIEIYGEGKMSRDFTYIDDLIDSVIALSAIPLARKTGSAPRKTWIRSPITRHSASSISAVASRLR